MDQTTDERIWSYVLGGMNDQGCKDMECAMQDDEGLRDKVRNAEQARRLYSTLVPLVDTDVDTDTLVGKIIKGWEQSDGSFYPHPSRGKETTLRRPEPVVSRPSTPYQRRALVAMAACLLVLLCIPSFFSADALDWMEPQLVVLKQKGLGADGLVPKYTAETFEMLSAELQKIINQEYKIRRAESLWSSWFRWRSDWRLQVQIHELYAGILQAEVAAYGDDPLSPFGTWMEYAESVDSFRSRVPSFGAEIATSLARMDNE